MKCLDDTYGYLKRNQKGSGRRESRKSSPIILLLLRAAYQLSYRGRAAYLQTHPEKLARFGLDDVPGKSCLQNAVGRLAAEIELFNGIIEFQTNGWSVRTVMGGSSGFGLYKYLDWDDAKRTVISRRLLVKLHMLMDASFRIVAFHATHGTSMIFRRMMGRIPEGSGYVLMNAAYDCKANCQLAADSGRKVVIEPRKNHVIKGFSTRQPCWNDLRRTPMHTRPSATCAATSSHSSIKARLGHMVRAKNLPTQTLDPAQMHRLQHDRMMV